MSTKKVFRPFHSIVSVAVILFIIASVFALWSWLRLEATTTKLHTSRPETHQEAIAPAHTMVDRVKRHMILPDQDPLVVIVDQTNELVKQHPFFTKAEVGDVILLYTNKAILYDPVADRLKNAGPLYFSDLDQISDSLAEPGLPEESVEPISIEVRNGSQVPGLAGTTGDELDGRTAYTVAVVGNAASYTYDENYVVVLNEGVDVGDLAQEFSATIVTELPSGEVSSDADVILILGNNE